MMTSAPASAAPIQITRFLRSTFGAMRRSWAEVSRIIAVRAPRGRMGRVRALVATSVPMTNCLILNSIFAPRVADGHCPDRECRTGLGQLPNPGRMPRSRRRSPDFGERAHALRPFCRRLASHKSSERSQLPDRSAGARPGARAPRRCACARTDLSRVRAAGVHARAAHRRRRRKRARSDARRDAAADRAHRRSSAATRRSGAGCARSSSTRR